VDHAEPVELLSEHDFVRYMHRGGIIVIQDEANRADRKRVAHVQRADKACSHVDLGHFREKVLRNDQTHGRYWWTQNSRIAELALEAPLCAESNRLLGRR
jgi:hypothetical protein